LVAIRKYAEVRKLESRSSFEQGRGGVGGTAWHRDLGCWRPRRARSRRPAMPRCGVNLTSRSGTACRRCRASRGHCRSSCRAVLEESAAW